MKSLTTVTENLSFPFLLGKNSSGGGFSKTKKTNVCFLQMMAMKEIIPFLGES